MREHVRQKLGKRNNALVELFDEYWKKVGERNGGIQGKRGSVKEMVSGKSQYRSC